MTKILNTLQLLAATLLLVLLSASAQAQPSRGVRDYDFRSDSNVRRDTRCLLRIDGDTIHDDYCDVYRQDGGRVTIVDAGGRKYKIVRDRYDNSSAEFQTFTGRTLDESMTTMQGGCWRGDRVKFCAR